MRKVLALQFLAAALVIALVAAAAGPELAMTIDPPTARVAGCGTGGC